MGLSDITIQLAQKLRISRAVVEYLSNTITSESQIQEILQAISKPPEYYYFRINLNKKSQTEVLEIAKHIFPTFQCAPGPIPNAIKMSIQGPFEMKPCQKQITCDRYAAESVMLGADLYIPGVKTVEARFNQAEDVSVILDLEKIQFDFPLSERRIHIANGRSAIRSADYPKYRKGPLVHNLESKYKTVPFISSELYSKGLISEQNLAPITAANILIDKILEDHDNFDVKIIDLCAAPGHKTAAMSEWGTWKAQQKKLEHGPEITAIDRSKNRFVSLEKDIQRLDLKNIQIIAKHIEPLLHEQPTLKNSADYVFFDPPCSALGGRPKIFLDHTQSFLHNFAENQRRLFTYADQLVKPGGILMYNTCTIPKEENEETIAYAVEKLHYSIIPINEHYSQLANPGISMGTLSSKESKSLLRFYPTIEENIGYFIALLQKK